MTYTSLTSTRPLENPPARSRWRQHLCPMLLARPSRRKLDFVSRDPGGSPDIPVYVERASSQGNPHPHPRPRRNGVLISDLLPNSFPRDSTQTILRFCVPDEPGRCRPKQKHLRACVGSRVAGVALPPSPQPPPSPVWHLAPGSARGNRAAGRHGAGQEHTGRGGLWKPPRRGSPGRKDASRRGRKRLPPAGAGQENRTQGVAGSDSGRCVVQPAPRSQGL